MGLLLSVFLFNFGSEMETFDANCIVIIYNNITIVINYENISIVIRFDTISHNL